MFIYPDSEDMPRNVESVLARAQNDFEASLVYDLLRELEHEGSSRSSSSR